MYDYTTSLVPGASQAIVATLVGYPMETTKTRLQTGMYNSTFECVKSTIRKEGFASFYRGVSSPLISHLLKRPYQFAIAEMIKSNKVLDKFSVFRDRELLQNYMIGLSIGMTGALFGNPLQIIKVQSQLARKGEYRGVSSIVRGIYKNRGIRGFYQGFRWTMFKDASFGSMFVGTYFTLRDQFPDTLMYKAVSGSMAHAVSWFCLIPIDNVKTNMQKRDQNMTGSQYVINTIKKNGIRYLWRGVVPACVRTVPVSGAGMLVYEATRNFMSPNCTLVSDK